MKGFHHQLVSGALVQKGRGTLRLLNAYIILFYKEKLNSSVMVRIILVWGSYKIRKQIL